MMNLERFGTAQIFRPELEAELSMRVDAEAHFRALIEPGVYRDAETISSALNHQFAFYQRIVDELLPQLASHDFNEFLLFQYDQATEANEDYKNGHLPTSTSHRWATLGPVLHRGLKFLCERVVLLQPPVPVPIPENEIMPLTNRLWVAMEQGTQTYLLSDQTYGVFPAESTLTVFAPGSDDRYFDLSIDRPYDYDAPVRRDRTHRWQFVGSPEETPLYDHDLRAENLDGPLEETIGTTYKQAVSLLSDLIEYSKPAPDRFPVLFLQRDGVIESAVRHKGMTAEAASRVLDGFTVRPDGLLNEGRVLFKPKQEHRAFRRGFLAMPHESGPHLAFSRSMAREAFLQLIQGLAFQKVPIEWRSPVVEAGLTAISQAGGGWFEDMVSKRLEERGFVGKRSLKVVGEGTDRLRVPDEVGEIDYLGYNPKDHVLLVGEAKLVQESAEPSLMRDDLSDFARGKKSYAAKLQKKVTWVRNNLPAVVAALASEVGTAVEPLCTAAVLVTFTPTIAEHFIEDFPCVSLTNLLLDYDDAGQWPYSKGVEWL